MYLNNYNYLQVISNYFLIACNLLERFIALLGMFLIISVGLLEVWFIIIYYFFIIINNVPPFRIRILKKPSFDKYEQL